MLPLRLGPRWTLGLLVALVGATAEPMFAQVADSVEVVKGGEPGVTHTRRVRMAGPLIINVLQIDLRDPSVVVRQVRATDGVVGREKTSDMVKRRTAAGANVIAALNADFFVLATGEALNNQIIDGEWWKGVRSGETTAAVIDLARSQFGMDSRGRPLIERLVFTGEVRGARATLALDGLNARPPGRMPNGLSLYTPKYGRTTRGDSTRADAEVILAQAARSGDTTWLVAKQNAGEVMRLSTPGVGTSIPADGAVLAAWGSAADQLAAVQYGDTLRVVTGTLPSRPTGAPLAMVIGGWPRILRDGKNVTPTSEKEEHTIPSNAGQRHPRSAVGFNRDSTQLFLVSVDGRSAKSVGVTISELADLMLEFGATEALNFDGGGSTTLMLGNRILNSPSDPTGERTVGNSVVIERVGKPSLRRPN